LLKARNYAHALGALGFVLGLMSAAIVSASAEEPGSVGPEVPTDIVETSQALAPKPVTITLSYQGVESAYATEATTFGELLAERGIKIDAHDYLSAPASTRLVDGMRFEYRPAVHVTIALGKHKISLQSAAPTVSDALAQAHVAVGPRDAVLPDRRSPLQANEIVRVTIVNSWTVRVRHTIAQTIVRRWNAQLALGKTRIVTPGVSGIREITTRFTRRGNAHVRGQLVASRIVRHPRPEIIERGTMVAESGTGFAGGELRNAMHLARSVLHVIATAYIAGCYKCSGITANGMHAGFGIIAVDPRLIPLGSKLMIPGYGRAIAGDTGGAIVGNRVDLGMNHLADALRFGRRAMTVYVLK
jgi:3D (Asp-Asp-Asp) domain-containing protein/uncharacterized protein YabE (DUF348 family)